MSEPAQYTFKIKNFTPETMPFGRLVEYYLELSKMIGVPDRMHLVDVSESSHASAIRIDQSCQTDVAERLASIAEGTAPAAAMKALLTIGQMLEQDNTNASLIDERGQNVIAFPGQPLDEPAPIKIRDTATFMGELYHIAGAKDDAKVRLKTEDYGVVYCSTTRHIAKALRDFLFEQVRVSGRGLWCLTEETGIWDIESFTITDFSPVKQETLRSAIDHIRARKIDWPDDPLGELDRLEDRNGSAQ